MKIFFLASVFSFLFLVGGNQLVFSQDQSAYFYENEFDFGFPLKKEWSMEIGFGNRGLLAEVVEDKTTGYQHQHVEINHFTHYEFSEFLIFSLGLRYRNNELFDESDANEFRIIEQIEVGSSNTSLPLSHRIRIEQRFRENTVHRLRYELELSNPINEVFSWAAATEALYSVSSNLKPEAEQRFSLGIENSSFKNLELEFIFEYRMEDYARDLTNEFFVVTGVSLAL